MSTGRRDERSLRVLILEDDPSDAELMLAELRRFGYRVEATVVDGEEEFVAALGGDLDVVISDYNLPRLDAPRALELFQRAELPIPFIVVSGAVGEERAVAAMRAGASDYLLKDRLARLGMAVQRALEMRASEDRQRRLQTAMEQTGDGMMIISTDSTILYVNPAFEAMTGFPAEEVVGETPRVLRGGEQSDELFQELGEAIDDGREWRGRMTHQRPDGRRLELDLSMSPIRNAAGEVVEFVGVGRDVSQQSGLERALRQAQKMEAVGRLAGGVAHDFNNLLTAILGYTELLRGHYRDHQGEGRPGRYLEEIHRAAERGSALTRQLLTFSRRQTAWPERLNLDEVVESIRGMLGRIIGEDVRLQVRPNGGNPVVEADRGHLEQMIVNLVVNSRDALPEGGNIILSTAERRVSGAEPEHPGLDPGEYAVLTVADDGEGIEPRHHERIFEPFFTTKSEGKGTGLGLSTVFGIVQEAGGGIQVDSQPGEGTTFTILLPTSDEADEAAAADEEPQTLVEGSTILVVEDEEATGRLIREVLAEDGHRVLLAPDAEEGLDTWRRHRRQIDLLITDVVLPGRTGPELADEIHQRHPEVPVLFMSGYPGGRLDQAHFDDLNYLPKPFPPTDLRNAVARALEAEGG